ncbi:hypothetical protein HMPREF1870_01058 [Bacteroidales bacterium KA00344]|nr:hypothetical protein HMPREF1870_01058 [Bacteroidales bacterium KA00344]
MKLKCADYQVFIFSSEFCEIRTEQFIFLNKRSILGCLSIKYTRIFIQLRTSQTTPISDGKHCYF